MCFAVAAAALAQFSERIEVRLHQLNVIVETKDGKPVTNLTKDDFIVLKDKKPQTITNFSVYTESGGQAPSPVLTAADSAAPAQPEPRERRRFVFFIDDVAIYPTSRNYLLERTNEILGVMGNGDEGMIYTPGSVQKIPLYFTGDKQALMTALARVTREMMFVSDTTPLDDPWEPKLPMAIEIPKEKIEVLRRDDCGQSLEICSKKRLASLKSVVKALAHVGGKKVLVLMTNQMSSVPGLAFTGADGANPAPQPFGGVFRKGVLTDFKTLQPVVDEVAREAAAANVTIYGIEPFERGVSTLPGVTSERGMRQAQPRMDREPENGTWDSLLTLATQTGGKAFRSANDFSRMFDQIASDVSTYYSIAFRDTPGKQAEFHNVQVRIKDRPELVVRTRRVVSSNTQEQDAADEVTSALLTSQPPNALGIDVTISPMVRAESTVDVPLRIIVPFEKLTFLKDGANHKAAFNIRVAAVGERGEFRAGNEQRQEVVVEASKFQQSRRDYYAYDMHLHLPPGKYRVAVRVADALSNERGFRTLTVTTQ